MLLVIPTQITAGAPLQCLSNKRPRCKRFKHCMKVNVLLKGDDFSETSDMDKSAASSQDFDELERRSRRRLGYIARTEGFSKNKKAFMYDPDDDRFWARHGKSEPPSLLSGANKYILAGIFTLGIGAGVAADTVLNIEPNNVASREIIDRQTPNSEICIANGMSALVLDQRLYISFNPFNVYVSQAEVKPGCVLLQSNWNVLESRGLVSSSEVRNCKRNMNTFGFVGDLRQAPEVNCVYHSESAENQFLKDPAKAALGDGFQPKNFDE